MTEQPLEARRLSKRYGRRTWALRDVDLALAAGGIVGLVGPNGAGKSTLLKTWIGFERPTAGEARVFGADPWRERAAVLSRTAYLPQSPALYRDLRVADHLDFVVHFRGARFDRAWAAKRLADLRVPLDATTSSLSGGQAAQVGLAIALGLRAAVLLLDEPLASLDPLVRREFIEVLCARPTCRGCRRSSRRRRRTPPSGAAVTSGAPPRLPDVAPGAGQGRGRLSGLPLDPVSGEATAQETVPTTRG